MTALHTMPRRSPSTYVCEVRAEGLVYGTRTTAHVMLGAFRTISPVLALRWLRGEALRIADGLDPDPATAPWLTPTRPPTAVRASDAPTDLRAWAADTAGQHEARAVIKSGRPVFVTAHDGDCSFTLSVRPSDLPAPGAEPPRPYPLTRHLGQEPRRVSLR